MADNSGPKVSLDELEEMRLRRLFYRQVGTVLGALFLCVLCAYGVPLVMDFYVLPNWITVQEQCGLSAELRISCTAILNTDQVSEASCHAAGCCWAFEDNNTQHCYHKFPSSIIYYIANASDPTDLKLNLRLGVDVNRTVLRNIKDNVRVRTRPYSASHVHIALSSLDTPEDDSFKRRDFEPRYDLKDTDYVVTYGDLDDQLVEGTPFHLLVRRRNPDNRTLLGSKLGTLSFTEDLIEFTTVLPSFDVYGLGLASRTSLRLEMPSKWTLLSHAGSADGGWPGVYPFYICVERDGLAHGVLLETRNIVKVETTKYPAVTFRILRASRLDLHVFVGSTPLQVVTEMINFVGKPQLPPLWALGFHACRHDTNLSGIVIRGMRAKRIPQESDCIGAVFSTETNFEPTQETNGEPWQEIRRTLLEQSQKLLLFLIPHVPIRESYGKKLYLPYLEGLKSDIFIKNANGTLLKAAPLGLSRSHDYALPNVFAPKYEDWMSSHLSQLSSKIQGFDGLVLDQNTPLDVTVPRASNPFKEPPPYWGRCTNNTINFPVVMTTKQLIFKDTICMDSLYTVPGRAHLYHINVHNVYGLRQSQVIHKVLHNKSSGLRTFISSRSSTTGSGRYSGHFGNGYGSSWDMLKYSLVHMLETSLYGVPMFGSAVCGSYGEPTYDLCSHWYQFSALNPFMFTYRGANQSLVDPYSLKPVRDVARLAIQVRYSLLEYMYTQLKLLSDSGLPFIRPMFLEYPEDKTVLGITGQFFFGPALMAVPVVNADTSEVDVYFPEGVFYHFFSRHRERKLGDGPGWSKALASEYQIALFLRAGHVVPLRIPAVSVALTRLKPLSLVAALRTTRRGPSEQVLAEGTVYVDDGISENPDNFLNVSVQLSVKIPARDKGEVFTFSINPRSSYCPTPEVNVDVHKVVLLGMMAKPVRIVVRSWNRTCDVPPENAVYKERTDVLILTKLNALCAVDLALWREIVMEMEPRKY